MPKDSNSSNGLSVIFPAFGLGQGVRAPNHLSQMVPRDMGVDLGGGDIGMPQKRLDAAQIRAAFHQMGGEGMAQDMGRDFRRIDAGLERQSLQQLMETAAGEKSLRAARDKQIAIV